MEYNDFNEGDMALELAKEQFLSMAVPELLSLAEQAIINGWLKVAAEKPDVVRNLYKILVTEESNDSIH